MELQLWERIQEKNLQINQKCSLTQGEQERLDEEFVAELSHNSTAIEGNTLTLRETSLILQGITIDKKPMKEHLEVIGHRDAFEFVKEIAKENATITERIIKDLHALVLMDKPKDRGIYRKIQVQIMGAYTVPTDPLLIQEKMESLLMESPNFSGNIVEKTARFHLLFEQIHPFIDGNGRTGRLLLNLQLMQAKFPPISIKYENQKAYYDAFDAYFRDQNSSIMEDLLGICLEQRLDYLLNL